MAVALDSNVVIGFLDEGDPLHESAEAKLHELLSAGEALCVSAVTLAEVLTGAELGHHDQEIVLGFFYELISEIAPVDDQVAQRAAQLRGRMKALKMPDALILATADVRSDVERIVCADRVAAKIEGLDCKVESLE